MTSPLQPAHTALPATAAAGDAGGAPVAAHTTADFTLSERTRRLLFAGVAANTRRAYTRQWDAFQAWCAIRGRCPLPATPETLTEYVAHLCDQPGRDGSGPAPASITQAMAAIRTAHATAGHQGHPDTPGARTLLRGYRRRRAETGHRNATQAPPVTIAALRAMVDVCDLSTPAGTRDRLLLVLGLALMGRRSELAALQLTDVAETGEGLEVTIRMSKTDQDAAGEVIAIPRGSHPLTDPVTAWREWIKVLSGAGITTGRLLRGVDRHGRIGAQITGDAINRRIRHLAVTAQVPGAATYTAHSLRAGGATVAYAAGIPVSTIARHGRWAPDSPVVLGYIRAVDRWRDNAMRNVGL
ncbi:tyrosine-type recombinase/integrase [Spirillospora sp. CA-255316]